MIESLLALQKPIMLFFVALRTPILNALASFFTLFGESYIPMAIICIVYWLIDKKKGFLIGSTLLSANVTNNILKVIVQVPRPFTRYPDEIPCLKESTATGYSFPSGHSATASAFWGTICKVFKNTWVKIVCILLIVLVPLSRVYLAAHWPLDVVVGTLVGLLFAFFFSSYISSIYDDNKKFFRTALVIAVATGILSIVVAILLQGNAVNKQWKDLMETSAMCSGLFLGCFLEKSKVNFAIPEGIKKKLIVLFLGIILGIGPWVLIRMIPFLAMIWKFVAYYYLALFTTFIYPWLCVKLGLMEKAK